MSFQLIELSNLSVSLLYLMSLQCSRLLLQLEKAKMILSLAWLRVLLAGLEELSNQGNSKKQPGNLILFSMKELMGKTKFSLVSFSLFILRIGPENQLPLIQRTHVRLKEQLGTYGYRAMELSNKVPPGKTQSYSISFMGAICQESVVCTQLIEGSYDSTLYEDVLYQILFRMRSDPSTQKKTIVVLMDNATFHHHSKVLETCRLMKANVLFNAEYSPWLNPIENFFGHVKKNVLRRVVGTK